MATNVAENKEFIHKLSELEKEVGEDTKFEDEQVKTLDALSKEGVGKLEAEDAESAKAIQKLQEDLNKIQKQSDEIQKYREQLAGQSDEKLKQFDAKLAEKNQKRYHERQKLEEQLRAIDAKGNKE
eukprot:TRINITY_DN1062_c0_g1_i2.p1 TRINITY_DN1062_c0_g1~~TRINITY_DN1062_c0_g1_i2.p1  ORF type:complete len:126 (+),score=41.19 TRINITY_DN1062_c0_g1_i2:129-506(+)